jgi:hypothetical protein
MFKSKKIIIFIIALVLFSCKEKVQTNRPEEVKPQKELNFDSILKCSDYSYDNGHFLTADYGCIYNPDDNNNLGNIVIYLVQKQTQTIADEQIIAESERINNLTIAEYKKEFKIYVFLIGKEYLNHNKSADPAYYQKSEFEEKAYTFDEIQKKWILIDSIKILNDSQNLEEQAWRENIISKSDKKARDPDTQSIEEWKGVYLNSDNPEISSQKEIKERIGWFEVKIAQNEITYTNDSRMESEFPTDSPGGYTINYKCDYSISGNTIRLYEKNDDDTSPPKSNSGSGQKLVIALTKKDTKYYAVSADIKEAESLENSARAKSKSPYLFYRFDLITAP